MNVNELALVQAYRKGATLDALAAATGLSAATVRRRLIGAGVELRQCGPRPIEANAIGPEVRPRLVRSQRAMDRDSDRRANPRAGRQARPISTRSSATRGETVDAEQVRLQLLDALTRATRSERAAAVAALSDDEVWEAAQALRIALDGGRGATSPTGSTRGVRPDGTRF